MALTKIKGAGVNISATEKLYFDDGGNTYIYESAADVLDVYVGGANMVKLTESTTDTVTVTGDLTVGVDGTGHDVKFFGDTASAYMLWDQSADDLVLAGAAGLDIAGDIDVDGTANLDVVDIDGAVQIDGTVTVGVDDTGLDVKFFGASAGAYALYDQSEDTLEVRGATAAGPGKLKLSTGELTVVDGDILGRIDFGAPLESDGTDAILSGAAIWAEADATFSASVNNTELVFATNTSAAATERMRIDSSGDVSIGVNAPYNPAADRTVLTLEGAATTTLELAVNGARKGYLYHNATHIYLANETSGGDVSLSPHSTGDVKIANGDIVFENAGKGICLGVTSNTDANTLDDYEEGTWTAAISDAGSGGNAMPMASGKATGSYVKVGNLVTVCGFIQTDWDESSPAVSGAIYIQGLPFSTTNFYRSQAGASIGDAAGLGITAGESVTGYMSANTTWISLRIWNHVNGTDGFTAAEWTGNGSCTISCTYVTF